MNDESQCYPSLSPEELREARRIRHEMMAAISPCDEQDRKIVSWDLPRWLRPFRRLGKHFARAIVNRGYERGFLNSAAFHAMHALIERSL